jgi:hypothetical protein
MFHLEKTRNGQPVMAASLLLVELAVPVHVNHDFILQPRPAEFDLGLVPLRLNRPKNTVQSIKVGFDIGYARAFFRSAFLLQPFNHL